MDFDFTPKEQTFADDVEAWLVENHDPVVMDHHRENFTQLADTPERRAFMKKLAAKNWLGMSWPKVYGGQEIEGVYEYILNEALSKHAAPQIGKGVGIIGKTLIRHGNEKLKKEFLPQILSAEVEFAVGYSEPQAGSDAANMQLKAEKVEGGWKLNGQKMWTTSAHFADWYWVGARTDPDKPKHDGLSLFLIPMNHPGLEIQSLPTIGKDTTNQVFTVHDVHALSHQQSNRTARRLGQTSQKRRHSTQRRSQRSTHDRSARDRYRGREGAEYAIRLRRQERR